MAGFVLVMVILLPALVISGSVVGTVIGLPLVVAALCPRPRGSARCTAGVLRIATG